MPKINIENVEVEIKDFCPRKVKKEINKCLYKDVEIGGDGKITGFSPESMDLSNDAAMLGMIVSLSVDGKPMPVTIETLDNLDTDVIDEIIAEINKITTKKIPNA